MSFFGSTRIIVACIIATTESGFAPQRLLTPVQRGIGYPSGVRAGEARTNDLPASHPAWNVNQGDWIRTSGLVDPNHALYQAELHPAEAALGRRAILGPG